MKKYDLVALPVVDDHNQLLSRITIDVVDLMEEEAEKDYQLASGLSDEVESDDSLWTMTRARLRGNVDSSVASPAPTSSVGSTSNGSLPWPCSFPSSRPWVATWGSNPRPSSWGLASGKSPTDARPAPACSRGVRGPAQRDPFAPASSWVQSLLLGYGWNLSLTVSMALIAVIIFAALFGTFVPLTLDKLKIDPALATGPFITTANDIIGLIIYFGIGVSCPSAHEGPVSGHRPPPAPSASARLAPTCIDATGTPAMEGVNADTLGATGIVLRSTFRVDDTLQASCPRLASSSADRGGPRKHVDLDAARRNIRVFNSPEGSRDADKAPWGCAVVPPAPAAGGRPNVRRSEYGPGRHRGLNSPPRRGHCGVRTHEPVPLPKSSRAWGAASSPSTPTAPTTTAPCRAGSQPWTSPPCMRASIVSLHCNLTHEQGMVDVAATRGLTTPSCCSTPPEAPFWTPPPSSVPWTTAASSLPASMCSIGRRPRLKPWTMATGRGAASWPTPGQGQPARGGLDRGLRGVSRLGRQGARRIRRLNQLVRSGLCR